MVTRPISDFKPDTDPEIWYTPGFRNVNRYAPVELDCTVRDSPVFRSLIVTVAPGTTAPEESFTVPARSPVVVVWAGASELNVSASAARIVTTENFVPMRMLPFPQIGLATTGRSVPATTFLLKKPNAETNPLGAFCDGSGGTTNKFRLNFVCLANSNPNNAFRLA